jgi:hypothetical protein
LLLHASSTLLQYRHYQALLDVFSLRPSKEAKEFGDLATFIAQVIAKLPMLSLARVLAITCLPGSC